MNQNPSLAEPCPFCSGDMHVIEDRGDNNCEPLLYRPQCKACGAGLGGFGKRPDAIDAWNTRAERLEAGTWQPGEEWKPFNIVDERHLDPGVEVLVRFRVLRGARNDHRGLYYFIGDDPLEDPTEGTSEMRQVPILTTRVAAIRAISPLPPTPAPGGGER